MSYTITNGLCTIADVKSALRDTTTPDNDRIALAIDAASRLVETHCNRRFWLDPVARTDTGCVLNGTAAVADASVVASDLGRQVIDPSGHNYIPTGSVVGDVVAGVGFNLVSFDDDPLPATGSATQSLTLGFTPRRYVSNDPWLVEIDDASTATGLVVQSDYAGDGTFGTIWEEQDFQTEPVNGIVQGQSGWPITKLRSIRSLYFPVWGGISYPRPYTQALVEVTARWGWRAIPSQVVKAAVVQSIALFKADDTPFGATPFAETGIVRMKTALHPTADLLLEPYSEDPVLVG